MSKLFAVPSLLALVAVASGSVSACDPPERRSFESEVAEANHIFIVRVVSAFVEDSGSGAPVMESATANVRVVRTFVGNPTLARIKFNISWCGGSTLSVGRYYLIATDIVDETMYLTLDSTFGIIDISQSYGLFSTKNPARFDLLEKALNSRPGKLEDGALNGLGRFPVMQ